MKLRILRPATLAGVGTFKPGTVVIIPSDVAEGWIKSGAARVEDGRPWVPGVEPETGPKAHKHYYRKDGTCACGAVRGKKAKSEPTKRQLREAAAEAKAKAKPRTQIEPDPITPEPTPEPEQE